MITPAHLDGFDLEGLVARALAEDIGSGDVTTAATVAPGTRALARITQKAPGVVYGLDVAAAVFRAVDPEVVLSQTGPEGVWRENGPVHGDQRPRAQRCWPPSARP